MRVPLGSVGSLASLACLLSLTFCTRAEAQTIIRPNFVFAVDNSGSMNALTGAAGAINSCGYSRRRINDVGCVIRNVADGIGDASFGLAMFNFGCRATAPFYPNGIGGCGTGTCPSATAQPAFSMTAGTLPYPSFYGCNNAGLMVVPVEERLRYTLRSWVDGVYTSCTTVPALGALGGNEMCMVPTSPPGALIGSTPNAGILREVYDYLSNTIPGTPSPYVNFNGTGLVDPFAACRPTSIIQLTDGNETCAGAWGAALNAANLGCLQVDLNGDGMIAPGRIPMTDPNPLVRGLFERNDDTNRDGDCYDMGEQRAFRVRVYPVQFEGTVGAACDCDTPIENTGRLGGTTPHPVGCSPAACAPLAGGLRHGYYARSEEEFAEVVSQIVADSALVETCNMLDDDCDTRIDETFSVGGACTAGTGVCLRTGTRVCSADGLGTVCSVTAGAGSAENTDAACSNGIDDDCDGTTDCADDDCVTNPVCRSGCVGGVEVCNGVDDDCDTLVDEGGAARACGRALGICTPGTETCVEQPAPGSGTAMYTRCTGTSGTEEVCNGIDDDCDGAIDDGIPVGPACGAMDGVCRPGMLRCVGGREVCVGGVPGRREVCNCSDDDCDMRVDEDPDGTLCPGESVCAGCQCALPCIPDEFGDRCPTGRLPDRSTGVCLCLRPPCSTESCALETVTRVDEIVCGPGSATVGPCVCSGAGCQPACDGVVCSPGTRCDPFDVTGRCVEDSCRTNGCMSGLRCNVSTGLCETDPCAGVMCMAGELCREGACVVDMCVGVTCPTGETCIDGSCRGADAGTTDAGSGGMDAGRPRVLASGGSCSAQQGARTAHVGWMMLALMAVLVWMRRKHLVAVAALALSVASSGCSVEPYCLACEEDPTVDVGRGLDAGDAPRADAFTGCRVGMEETCNGRDDDCDTRVDETFDLQTSLDHCGACDDPCAPSGAFGVCELGVCRIESCDVGFIDLDMNDANGCEYGCTTIGDTDVFCDALDDDCDGRVDENVDLAMDPANCGMCGRTCRFANGVGMCAASACVLGACDAGFYDLDGNPDTGCEYSCAGAIGGVEACNGIDDNCDGMIDEGVTPPVGLCRTLGACAGAVPTCMGALGFRCAYGTGVEVEASGQPIARETRCDGIDGNCNGATDEAFRTLGNACFGTGIGACRTSGTFVCAADATGALCNAAAGPAPGVELCNGLDDDCDGLTDEPRSAPGTSPSFVNTAWVQVSAGLWMMQYEASRPDATASAQGALSDRACSVSGVLPWTSLRQSDAAAACSAFGARLCTEAEFATACRGTSGTCTWAQQPMCSTFSATACNTADRTDPDVLMTTGALAECRSVTTGGSVYDLSGNVKEFTQARPSGRIPLRGGSYNQGGFGATCNFDWQVVSSTYRFENVGFRCCFSGATAP